MFRACLRGGGAAFPVCESVAVRADARCRRRRKSGTASAADVTASWREK